ncbi:hypothetical protein M9978_08305 [Sphingomonas sp. MG17]|uniref:Uncharacterized protein n=1 Tax=Sphingomonas tagetis TaxID=2949092 RepID=A0A9X2HMJ7_9SPHN|nr:hypothetical protein [Sphingomonas tagetis]MCP3730429.1 hypothetical protein [Sphingomonas tagetis]
MTAVVPWLVGGVVGGLLSGKKKTPEQPAPVLAPRRNEAREAADARDRVSKRRGVAANLILGAGGAESTTGSKGTLGS